MTGTFAADPAVTGGIVNRTIVTVTTPILTRLVDADRVALEVVAVIPVFNGEAVLG